MVDNNHGDFMTSFILKIIGIFTMFCDHVGDALIGHFSFCNYIGRLSFPIFAFQTVQGYIHTSNIKKHIGKLFIFACISQIPFMLFTATFCDDYYLNVFFTLLLGILALLGFDNIKNKYIGTIFVALMCTIGHFLKVDYGWYGVLAIFVFYIFQSDKYLKFIHCKKFVMCISFVFITIIKYIPDIVANPSVRYIYLLCTLCTCLSLIPICFYNGKQGPKSAYLFYVFYPLHLLVLAGIHYLL